MSLSDWTPRKIDISKSRPPPGVTIPLGKGFNLARRTLTITRSMLSESNLVSRLPAAPTALPTAPQGDGSDSREGTLNGSPLALSFANGHAILPTSMDAPDRLRNGDEGVNNVRFEDQTIDHPVVMASEPARVDKLPESILKDSRPPSPGIGSVERI